MRLIDIAQLNLGAQYENGQGIEKDLGKAAYWYQKAAEQGVDGAQYNLGICYYYGKGVTIDVQKAKYWLKKAADQGNDRAKQFLRGLEETELLIGLF